MNFEISFIIPVYNCEKYIIRCYDSIKLQGIDYEIIFVDDGSIDKSKEIIDNLCVHDSNIKYIYQDNSGPHIARINGLRFVTKDHIMFVDSDDYLEFESIKHILSEMEKNNVECILFDIVKEYNNPVLNKIMDLNIKEGFYNKEEIIKFICPLLFSNNIMCSLANKIFRTNIIDKKNTIEYALKYGEDGLFFMNVIENINNIQYVKKVVYHYCDNDEITLTKKKYNNYIESVLIPLYKEKKKYAFSWGYNDLWRTEFIYLYVSEIMRKRILYNIFYENNMFVLQELKNIHFFKFNSPKNVISLRIKIIVLYYKIVSTSRLQIWDILKKLD